MAENANPNRDQSRPPESDEAAAPPADGQTQSPSTAQPEANALPPPAPPNEPASTEIDSGWLNVPDSEPLPDDDAEQQPESAAPAPEAAAEEPAVVEPEPSPVTDAPTVPPADPSGPGAVAPIAEPAPQSAPDPGTPRRGLLANLFRRGRTGVPAAPTSGDQPQPPTVTDRARKISHAVLHPAGALLARMGVHPDQVTLAGTLLVFVAAALIGLAQLQLGALLLLFALPFDALDGAVARAMGRSDRFGALLDSASDRYADAAIFAGLGYHFAVQDRLELLLLAFAGLMGTYAVSYVRARAEGLGVDVKIGLFTRLERLAMILIMLFVPDLLPIGLIILAIGTNFTSVQRLLYVYRVLKQREG